MKEKRKDRRVNKEKVKESKKKGKSANAERLVKERAMSTGCIKDFVGSKRKKGGIGKEV